MLVLAFDPSVLTFAPSVLTFAPCACGVILLSTSTSTPLAHMVVVTTVQVAIYPTHLNTVQVATYLTNLNTVQVAIYTTNLNK